MMSDEKFRLVFLAPDASDDELLRGLAAAEAIVQASGFQLSQLYEAQSANSFGVATNPSSAGSIHEASALLRLAEIAARAEANAKADCATRLEILPYLQ